MFTGNCWRRRLYGEGMVRWARRVHACRCRCVLIQEARHMVGEEGYNRPVVGVGGGAGAGRVQLEYGGQLAGGG